MSYMRDLLTRRLDTFAVRPRLASRSYIDADGSQCVPIPLITAHAAGAATLDLNRTQRTMFMLPVAVTQWRVRYGNINVFSNTALTTPITVTGTYVGSPTYTADGGRWNGGCTAALTQVAESLTVPVNGTYVASPWITTPIPAHTPVVISAGLSSTDSGTGIAKSESTQACYFAGAANAGTALPSGIVWPVKTAFVDTIIDIVTTDDVPIGLFLGDSITSGISDQDPIYGIGDCLPFERFPEAAGLRGGFLAINAGVPSATASAFDNADNYSLSRLAPPDIETTTPDFAVVALGTNEAPSSGSLTNAATTTFAPLAATQQLMASMGVAKTYLTTLIPRTDVITNDEGGYGALTEAASEGDTSITSSISVPSGTPILLGQGVLSVVVTTTGAPTGSGPYSIPVPALANAYAVGVPVYWGAVAFLQYFNSWARQVPGGFADCIDLEDAIANPKGTPVPDARYISTSDGGLHPSREGYRVMAARLAFLGVLR